MTSVSSGYVDLERGILHRSGANQRRTKKRQPPVKIPPRLLAHLKRWKRMDGDIRHVVHWNGSSVLRVKKAFRSACKNAGLGWYVENKKDPDNPIFKTDVVPHTLRHTCATWLMQAGIEIWEAAGFLGMSVQMVEQNYAHHHPSFQSKAAEAIGRA